MASLMIMVERHLYAYMSLFVIIMIVPWENERIYLLRDHLSDPYLY
jgi:hypothetical protein